MASPKHNRRKGHDLERLTARELRALYPDAHRGLQYQDGPKPCDVEGTPWAIECKYGKSPSVWAALAQCLSDRSERNGDDRPPLLIVHKTNCAKVAVVEWSVFIELLKRGSQM